MKAPPDGDEATGNLFYDTWVKKIDIAGLLSTADLTDGAFPSLLYGGVLDGIAADMVATVRGAVAGAPCRVPWLANPLQIYLSLSNIRGVPYLIQMTAADPIRGHRTIAHGDYAHFAVRDAGIGDFEPVPPGATPINWPTTRGTPAQDGWDRLAAAALSTSAFPMGLPARPFENPRQLYDAKLWNRLTGEPEDGSSPTIAPDLAPATLDSSYAFWTIDGGAINNEPLEYARIALSGAPDAHNPRDGRQANRAVLMIDPFPEDTGQDRSADSARGSPPDMFRVAGALLSTIMQQARFKPDEIRLALHEDIHSRFLIAPIREGRTGAETHMASDGTSGFSGFFHEAFRSHDFFLGRRNAQQFLRNHLVVHRDNPIVSGWVGKLAGKLGSFHPKRQSVPGGPWVMDEDYVQLIPLFGTATAECVAPKWPTLSFARDIEQRLEADIQNRAKGLAEAAMTTILNSLNMDQGLIRNLIDWFAEKKLRNLLKEKILQEIRTDLLKRNLAA